MKTTPTTHNFTYMEILLCLFIIAIASVSILGLFPISMRVHRGAMANQENSDLAEDVLNYACTLIRTESNGNNLFNQDRYSLLTVIAEDASLSLQGSLWGSAIPEEGLDGFLDQDFTDLERQYYRVGDNLWRIVEHHNIVVNGIPRRITRTDVVIGIWKEEVERLGLDYSPYDDPRLFKVCVEASWPASAEYGHRRKLSLYTEVRRWKD